MCIDELEAGRKPYCVAACMMRVLDIGSIDKIWDGTLQTTAIGPNDKVVKQVKNMSNPDLTKPSIGFIPHSKATVGGYNPSIDIYGHYFDGSASRIGYFGEDRHGELPKISVV
jgi:Fe-S-cluster-containing dehydrogenase component